MKIITGFYNYTFKSDHDKAIREKTNKDHCPSCREVVKRLDSGIGPYGLMALD